MLANLLLMAAMAITPTDQTVQVTKGMKLDVNNFAGDVNIKVWDKDAVRVEVNNSDREVVDINKGEQAVGYCFIFLYIAAHGAGRFAIDKS